jgi:uncharacterized Rmd1/YagE family protein
MHEMLTVSSARPRKNQRGRRPETAEPQKEPVTSVYAIFVGNGIEVRSIEPTESVSITPLTVRVGKRGLAVVFRYGALVFFDATPEERTDFIREIRQFITEPFDRPETEDLTISQSTDGTEQVDADGTVRLIDASLGRLHIVAHVLAKSVVLAHYEVRVGEIFDRIDRLVSQMKQGITPKVSGRDLLEQIGDVLIAQTQTVGRVEVTEKPESTWDRPDLDRLYERLSLEYELRDRDRALTRKLDFISQTAQTYLDMLQTRQSLRVEWYIVILILVEIVLIVYDIFLA